MIKKTKNKSAKIARLAARLREYFPGAKLRLGRILRLVFAKKNIGFLGLYFIILLLARVDLASKDVVFEHLAADEAGGSLDGRRIIVSSFFDIVAVKNTGISFGLFGGMKYGHFILATVVMSISLIFFIYMHFQRALYYKISTVLILSGAVGNLYDRIKFGYVRDFLDFHYDVYRFPAFNFADVFVSCGVSLMVIADIVINSKKKKDKDG